MIQPARKQGRNELCNCGSGKKFKKCCGLPAEPTVRDVLKCLYLMLDLINKKTIGFKRGQPVEFPKDMLDKVPNNFVEKIICRNQGGGLVLFAQPAEQSIIQIPTLEMIRKIGKTGER